MASSTETTAPKCEKWKVFELTPGSLTKELKLAIPSTYSITAINQLSYSAPYISEVFNIFFRGKIAIDKNARSFVHFGALAPSQYNPVKPNETFITKYQNSPKTLVYEDGFNTFLSIQYTMSADEEMKFYENPQVYADYMLNLYQNAVKRGWESFFLWFISKMFGAKKEKLKSAHMKRFFEYYEDVDGKPRPAFLNKFNSLEPEYALWKDGVFVGFGACCTEKGEICESCKGAKVYVNKVNPLLDLIKKISTGIDAHTINTLPSKFIPHCVPEGPDAADSSTDFSRLKAVLGFFEKIADDLYELQRDPQYWSDGGVYANSSGTESGRKPIVLMNTKEGRKQAFCFNFANGDCNDCTINDYNGTVLEVPPDTLDLSDLVLIVDAELLNDYERYHKYVPNIKLDIKPDPIFGKIQIIPVAWLPEGTGILIHKQAIHIHFRVIEQWSESTKDNYITTVEKLQGGDYTQYRQKMGIFIACDPHKLVRKYVVTPKTGTSQQS